MVKTLDGQLRSQRASNEMEKKIAMESSQKLEEKVNKLQESLDIEKKKSQEILKMMRNWQKEYEEGEENLKKCQDERLKETEKSRMKDTEIETLKKEQLNLEEKLKRREQEIDEIKKNKGEIMKNMKDWLQEMENL